MNNPTQKQINNEVAKLEKLKGKIQKTSAFGDNHVDAIEAQVRVLKERLTDQQIEDKSHHEDEDEDDEHAEDESLWKQNVRDAAMDARNWLTGQVKEPPSKGWLSLVKK